LVSRSVFGRDPFCKMMGVLFPLSVLSGVGAAVHSNPGFVTLNNGVVMPQVSLGTAGYDDATVSDALVLAVDVGFTGVDTAYNYGNQRGVGDGLKRVNRSSVFVTTKTTDCEHHGITDAESCARHTRSEVEADFSQLNVEHIDLLLLHGANHEQEGACDDLATRLDVAQWQVYEEYYRAGKVRAIGVSNYCPSCLDGLLKNVNVTPAVNQLQYHVGMTSDPQSVMSYCVGHNIVPMAYSPMGGGSVFSDSLTTEIATAHDKTAAQVALKWITDKGYTLTTKSNNRQHLESDLDLFSWSMTPDELSTLDSHHSSSDLPSWACTASAMSGDLAI